MRCAYVCVCVYVSLCMYVCVNNNQTWNEPWNCKFKIKWKLSILMLSKEIANVIFQFVHSIWDVLQNIFNRMRILKLFSFENWFCDVWCKYTGFFLFLLLLFNQIQSQHGILTSDEPTIFESIAIVLIYFGVQFWFGSNSCASLTV